MDRYQRAIDAYKRMRDVEKSSPGALVERERVFHDTPDSGPDKLAESPQFEKTGFPVSQEQDTEPTGAARAARLLIALGSEQASKVLGELSEEEVESIAAEVMRTPVVRRSEAERLVADIGEMAERRRLRGGPETAREMLVAAFGEEVGERFFYRSVPHAAQHHFGFLNDLERHQLSALLRDESPTTIALIVTHIDRALAAGLLADLDPDERNDVVRRIGRMGKLSRDVVLRVEEAVRDKIRNQGRVVTQGVEGTSTLAAILRHMPPSEETSILRQLELTDGDLSRSVKDELFTTDVLFAIADRDLADLMREFGDSEIALFLKGKEQPLRVRVLNAISDRRRLAVSDEYAHLGSQPQRDVDDITRELLERVRELEAAGELLVPRDGERYI